jgi:hypothetical protein
VQSGQLPKIRTFKRENRYIPWYQDTNYNPYRDYYNYERDWYPVQVNKIEIEYEPETVVIYADQPEYRDYNVQRVEQQRNWNSNPVNYSPEEQLAENQRETDFSWSESQSEVESQSESNFFSVDPS